MANTQDIDDSDNKDGIEGTQPQKINIALKIKAKNGVLQHFIDYMGWTQADFARAVGFQVTQVGEWFNMKNYPRSKETMDKVTSLVGKTATEIFPDLLRDPAFLKANKKAVIHREIDIEYLPFKALEAIAYEAQMQDDLDLPDAVTKALQDLKPREKDILDKRFGMNGKEPMTLEQLAKEFYCHKERIRQIEQKALSKLRHPQKIKLLAPFKRHATFYCCYNCSKKKLLATEAMQSEDGKMTACHDCARANQEVKWEPISEDIQFPKCRHKTKPGTNTGKTEDLP